MTGDGLGETGGSDREADRRPAVPRGERGAITVADRVVEKIGSQVAREVLSRFTERPATYRPAAGRRA